MSKKSSNCSEFNLVLIYIKSMYKKETVCIKAGQKKWI